MKWLVPSDEITALPRDGFAPVEVRIGTEDDHIDVIVFKALVAAFHNKIRYLVLAPPGQKLDGYIGLSFTQSTLFSTNSSDEIHVGTPAWAKSETLCELAARRGWKVLTSHDPSPRYHVSLSEDDEDTVFLSPTGREEDYEEVVNPDQDDPRVILAHAWANFHARFWPLREAQQFFNQVGGVANYIRKLADEYAKQEAHRAAYRPAHDAADEARVAYAEAHPDGHDAAVRAAYADAAAAYDRARAAYAARDAVASREAYADADAAFARGRAAYFAPGAVVGRAAREAAYDAAYEAAYDAAYAPAYEAAYATANQPGGYVGKLPHWVTNALDAIEREGEYGESILSPSGLEAYYYARMQRDLAAAQGRHATA